MKEVGPTQERLKRRPEREEERELSFLRPESSPESKDTNYGRTTKPLFGTRVHEKSRKVSQEHLDPLIFPSPESRIHPVQG